MADVHSKVAMAARLAGMSWGNFVATPDGHRYLVQCVNEDLDGAPSPRTKLVTCIQCGRLFEIAKRSQTKICGEECRKARDDEFNRKWRHKQNG